MDSKGEGMDEVRGGRRDCGKGEYGGGEGMDEGRAGRRAWGK